jgi:hypothetical protein
MLRRLWDRLDRGARVALIVGVVVAIAVIPLPTWMPVLVGFGASVLLGYLFPAEAVKVGVLVAAPILCMGFLLLIIRGAGLFTAALMLGACVVIPVALARVGAGARVGKPR